MPPFAHLLIAFALGLLLGTVFSFVRSSARGYQNWGEQLVSETLGTKFPSPDYHLLNHITLPLKGGSTQIDHILVSRFGVFVIETKAYKGWIFASTNQPTWTQVIYTKKYRFQNPILQNLGHVKAVQDLLDFLPSDAVCSAVVFAGEAEFKTDVPPGVFDLSGLVKSIQENRTEVMSVNRVQFCVGRIETARLAITAQTDIEHIENIERRRGAV